MRTYAGHSSAGRVQRAVPPQPGKGQTGLSVAFDLPTQTGYDPDAELARGEVGKVGVPISHIGDLRTLFDGIPLDDDEHVDDDQRAGDVPAGAVPDRRRRARGGSRHRSQRAARRSSPGTTQNDIIKEYLSRGTYVFPPAPSLRLITDMIAYTVAEVPEVEPDQRLQLPPAGGRRDARCRRSRSRCARRSPCSTRCATPARSPPEKFGEVVARISFFVNAGVRFIEEMCKLRAFGQLWDEITRERYGVAERQAAPLPLRRAGQLARPDRGPAGEQRLPDPARDAGGDDVAGRPRPRRAAAGLERGARPAAGLGPAVVAAHAAGAGLRVRPARVRGPVRGLAGRRGQGRRDQGAVRGPRSTASSRWAARSRRSSPAT